MIPAAAITAWSAFAPWATLAQIEQDLILSRLIVEIAEDPTLGPQLAMRGGTACTVIVVQRLSGGAHVCPGRTAGNQSSCPLPAAQRDAVDLRVS